MLSADMETIIQILYIILIDYLIIIINNIIVMGGGAIVFLPLPDIFGQRLKSGVVGEN